MNEGIRFVCGLSDSFVHEYTTEYSMVYCSPSFQSHVCLFLLNKVHKTEMEMPKRGGDGWPQGKLNIDSIRAKMTLKDATRGGLLKVCTCDFTYPCHSSNLDISNEEWK